MGYPMPPFAWKQPRPKPARPQLPPALPAGLEQQFAEREFLGASYGATFPVPATPPPPGIVFADDGLVIEPPPWAGQTPVAALTSEPAVPVAQLGAAALAEMRTAAGDEPEPQYKVGPPARDYTPNFGVPIPEADWREEERLRVHALGEEQQ